MTQKDKFRIGAVSYLNTLPLVYGLQETRQSSVLLSFDLPSRLADQLRLGQLDVALIPSIEVFQNPDYVVVSDACIACCGPVWSVKLMSRVPLSRIRTLALDEGSRTSAALSQILLHRECAVTPQLQPLPINTDWQDSPADAVLIIGDRAMNPSHDGAFGIEIDLGEWWYNQTGLPFVFAMWTARPGINQKDLNRFDDWLSASRDAGVADSIFLAQQNADRYGLTAKQAADYFSRYLHFRLGSHERMALDKFRQLANRLSLAPNTLQLQFHDC